MTPFMLLPDPSLADQRFTVTVPLDNHAFRADLRLRWSESAGHWFLTLRDGSDGCLLVNHLPLIAGTDARNDLFRPFHGLRIGSLFCHPNRDEARHTDPSRDTLASFDLIWTEEATV